MFWEMKENVEEDWVLHNLSKIERKKKLKDVRILLNFFLQYFIHLNIVYLQYQLNGVFLFIYIFLILIIFFNTRFF
jgi:hypothetical protein